MTSPGRRRGANATPPARVGKAERRRQLVAHAKTLFSRHGYPGTTPEMVAEAAGVTAAVLGRHFGDKIDLFREVLDGVRAVTLWRWREETAGLTDPLARLQAVTALYLNGTSALGVEFKILHRALSEADDERVVGLLRDFYLDAEGWLAAIIAEGQNSGVFRRSLDARVGAWELIRTALGYSLTLPLGVPLYAEPDYPTRAVECLLHGLLKTDV